MPKTGGIISHAVGLARDVASKGVVTKVTLMDAVKSQEVGGRTGGGSGAGVVPNSCGDVIAEGGNGAATEVHMLGQDVMVHELSSRLEVGIGNGAMGIGGGNEVLKDVGRKFCPPNKGGYIRVGGGGKPSTAHATAGSVVWANCNRVIWNNFRKLGGTAGQGVGEVFEVGKLVSHFGGDPDAIFIGVPKALLE